MHGELNAPNQTFDRNKKIQMGHNITKTET